MNLRFDAWTTKLNYKEHFVFSAPKMQKQQGRVKLPDESEDDIMLRVDFIREVDELLQEVKAGQSDAKSSQVLDPESVAMQLKHQEKQRTIFQVEALLELAINLQW